MLTTKKRGRAAAACVAAVCWVLAGCGPPGIRALHKGDRLVQSGKYAQAVEVLERATNQLAKDPALTRAKARNLLGLAYHGAGNAGRARVCYEDALSLNRNGAAEAGYNLGCLELEQTNLPAARDALTTYTSLRMQDRNGHMKLGLAYYLLATNAGTDSARQLDLDKAAKSFETAQRIQVTAEAWNDLAVIDLVRKPKLPPTAISNALVKLKAALGSDRRYAPALLNIAVVYDPSGPYKYGDVQSAMNAYHEYLALNPPPAQAADVALLVTNLDRTARMTIQRPNHPPEQPAIIVPPVTNALNIEHKKTNAPPHPSVLFPGPPPETSPAPEPAPGADNPPGATTPAPPKPEEPPPSPATGGPRLVAPVLPEHNLPAPGGINTAPMTDQVRPETNFAVAAAPADKPSLLGRLFGGRPKPVEGGPDLATRVTPLPAPRSSVHYAPPAVSLEPGNRAEAGRLAAEGAAAEKQSRFKDAMERYEAAVKADPAYYDACEALGMAAIKSGEYGVALEALHHALAINPDSANARYGYAWTLAKKNYVQDAANELEILVSRHNNEVRAHLLLGNLYSQKLGQPDLARAHYKKVLEKEPQNDQAAGLRAWLQNNPEP
jgi:tetratricopeptide (TPR) repeat protein